MLTKMKEHWNVLRRSILQVVGCYMIWVCAWVFYQYKLADEIRRYLLIIFIFLSLGIYAILFLLSCFLVGFMEKVPVPNRSKEQKLFLYIHTRSFWLDFFHVFFPFISFVLGFFRYLQACHRGSVKMNGILIVTVWICVLSLFCIILSAIFPYQYFKRIRLMAVRREVGLSEAWLSVTDSERYVSSFSLLPYIAVIITSERERLPIVYSENDIEFFNKKYDSCLSYLNFNKCLFYLAGNKRDSKIVEWMNEVKRVPHMKCVFMLENKMALDLYKEEINDIQKTSMIHIIYVEKPIFDILTLSKYIGNINVSFNARNIDIPRKIMDNGFLRERYLDIHKGPQVVTIMLSKIFNELEPLAGIYALFDMMDLMLRLSFAFYAPKEKNWYYNESNGRKMGNLNEMTTLLEKKEAFFLGKKLPENIQALWDYEGMRKVYIHEILTEEEILLIRRYLANYSIPETEMNYAGVIYLCRQLRNAIRGHGSVASDDMWDAMVLVFKLVLSLFYILAIEQMGFTYDKLNHLIRGQYGKEDEGKSSTFKCYRADEVHEIKQAEFLFFYEGNMKIFNNYVKEKNCLEYIDFISGTLMTPSYIRID